MEKDDHKESQQSFSTNDSLKSTDSKTAPQSTSFLGPIGPQSTNVQGSISPQSTSFLGPIGPQGLTGPSGRG